MKCKACKNTIPDGSIFCMFCGEQQIKQREQKKEISVPKPRKLPSGTWFAQVMVDGVKHSVSAPTEKEYYTKARALKAGLIDASKKGVKHTLDSTIRKYIDSNVNVLSPATIRGYEVIYRNRFKAYMGVDIAAIDYQKMINEESTVVSPKSVMNAWGLVRSAIKATGVTPPEIHLPKRAKYNGDFLDYEQIEKFLIAIRGSTSELAAILALHGLRQSEILDLDVTDIKTGNINVQGATVQDKNNVFVHKDTNKNITSSRTVPVLIPRLYELLPPSGKLVSSHPSVYRRGIEKACIAANVPVCSIHDLRRSFASLAYHLGWQDRTTMVVGGWSDTKTIKAVYEKLSEQDRIKDIKKMQNYYSEISNRIANEI